MCQFLVCVVFLSVGGVAFACAAPAIVPYNILPRYNYNSQRTTHVTRDMQQATSACNLLRGVTAGRDDDTAVAFSISAPSSANSFM